MFWYLVVFRIYFTILAFCDFLFAFLQIKYLLELVYSILFWSIKLFSKELWRVEKQIGSHKSCHSVKYGGKTNHWLCWGLTTRQPLWVILCRLPERGRKETEESRRDEREGQGRKRNRNESEETEEIKHHLPTLTCYKDSRPCQTVSQYQLDAPVKEKQTKCIKSPYGERM